MTNSLTEPKTLPAGNTIPHAALLQQWQEHRKLTRRVIEAFPEEALFNFSIGGMRPFSLMVTELLEISGPGIIGIATGHWAGMAKLDRHSDAVIAGGKEALLQQWDDVTGLIDAYWPQVSVERLQENDIAFGQYAGRIFSILLYFIDNEIHHRAQAYVYLRALGIEPPPFWDRVWAAL